MREKKFLSKLKNIFTPKRTKYSGLFGMSFVLMLVTLFTWQCKEDTYEGEVTGICPEVIATNPLNSATNVVTNKIITATFNETMQPSSINETTYYVKKGSTLISGTVTFSGITAVFTPSALLDANTVYTATVTRGATDLMGNVMKNDYTWSFNTGLSPNVILTDPLDGASDVALNKVITADFSTAMNPATINSTTFILKQGTTPVAGVVTYLGVRATFTPTVSLLPNKVYTATITNKVTDVAGNAMKNDYTWSFSTGLIPLVLTTDPKNGEINVTQNKTVTATFSKIMNAATLNNASFTLMNGTTPIAGTVSYTGYTAEFDPLVDLLPGVEYTATITTGAKDMAGNSIAANYIWKFTTNAIILPYVTSTDPKNATLNVELEKVILATFSKEMNVSTINGTTFTLMQGTTPVTGNVSYDGAIARFKPQVNLLPGVEYTATITTGAKDLAGNSIAANYIWKFTTSVIVRPVVLDVDPDDLATNVALNKVVSATFSKAMDLSTINSSTFTLKNGTIPVFGFVDYSNVTGTFTPSTPLLPGTLYTATITTGAKDLAGNALAANYVWSFTTAAAAAQFTVGLSSSPQAGGNTSGGGMFNGGASATVNATANSGYSFVNWTEGSLIVSTLANYTFIVNNNRTLVANFSTVSSGPGGIDLGSAANFAILAGAGVTNTGVTTLIKGDVGSFPTATIAGLLPANVIGTLYTSANSVVGTAKNDLTTAFNDAQSRSLNAISLPGQLGGLTLAPGLYVNSSTSGISGTGTNGILTLDAGGSANAVWIFKMGSTLITGPGTSIVLAGGAQAKNIYWSVGTSATLGTNSVFYGNILADQSITLNTGAVLYGRALTRIAAVTLDSNTVTKP